MFIAGVVPGILMGLIMMLVVYVFAVKRDFSAGPKTSWKEKWEATGQALPCIGLPIIVVGGIMGGFFTPTEAAAAAVLYSLILSAFVYRTVGWKELWEIDYRQRDRQWYGYADYRRLLSVWMGYLQ